MSNGTAAETGHHRLLGPAQQVCFSRLERIASGLPCSNAGIFRWTHTSLSEKGQSCQKQRIRVPGSPSSFCFMHTEVPSPGLWHIPRSSLPMIAEAMGAKKGSLRNKNKCLSCVLTHRICLRNSNQMGTGGTQGLKAWTSYPGWHMQMWEPSWKCFVCLFVWRWLPGAWTTEIFHTWWFYFSLLTFNVSSFFSDGVNANEDFFTETDWYIILYGAKEVEGKVAFISQGRVRREMGQRAGFPAALRIQSVEGLWYSAGQMLPSAMAHTWDYLNGAVIRRI